VHDELGDHRTYQGETVPPSTMPSSMRTDKPARHRGIDATDAAAQDAPAGA
jgi:hypothetical protein